MNNEQVTNKKKGKFIVIEGGDGSGKTVQAKLLVEYLKKQRKRILYLDFPNYDSFFGKLAGRFLNGEFGTLDEISPYLISLPYALDQASANERITTQLANGGYVIANRYLTSSMAHQTAKLPQSKRAEFLQWFENMAFNELRMFRPDLVIYLYVPWKIGLELTKKKADSRQYTKGLDIAERDIQHRIESEKLYLQLAKNKNWVKIDCVDEKGNMLSKRGIHEKISEKL